MCAFSINKEPVGSVLTISLSGRIDASAVPELEAEIKSSLGGVKRLVLGFEKVSYISSSGLRMIRNVQRNVERIGGTLVISYPSDSVREVLDVTGFSDMLTIEP